MKIRSHYRQLGPDEVIRRGDLWQTVYGTLVGRVKVSIGGTPRSHSLLYTFWRRRHVNLSKFQKPVEPAKQQQHPVEKNPLVKFFYPSSKGYGQETHRVVRLIGANEFYFVGLQVNDKNRFKKFRRDKMSNLSFVEFSPESIS